MNEVLKTFEDQEVVKKYTAVEAAEKLEPIIEEIWQAIENKEITTQKELLEKYDGKISEIYNSCAVPDNENFQVLIKKFEEMRDKLPKE